MLAAKLLLIGTFQLQLKISHHITVLDMMQALQIMWIFDTKEFKST
jgi:hypothetical protein